MQTQPFYINDSAERDGPVEFVLSFRPFIDYLEKKIATDKGIKVKFYKHAYNQIINQLESSHAVSSSELQDSLEIMELMYATFSPIVVNEDTYIWALSTPVPNKIIYSTDAFYKLIHNENTHKKKQHFKKDLRLFRKDQLVYIYKLILKRLYNFAYGIEADFNHVYEDADTGLCTYYRVHVDDSFIQIEVKGKLPALDFETFEHYLQDENNLSALMQIIPLHMFRLKGFSIITVSDVTFSHSLQQIRHLLIDRKADDAELYRQVVQSLRTLTGKNSIEFSLSPFVKLNGRHVINVNPYLQSVCVQSVKAMGIEEKVLQSFFSEFESNPRPVFYPSVPKTRQDHHPFMRVLKEAGIQSFGVLPVFYRKQLTGVVEIYSRTEMAVDEKVLSAVEIAIPLLAQLLQNSIDSFNTKISSVILEKFTTLQPAVQWKFNEVAFNYLKSITDGVSNPKMGSVVFKDVYPLYGAVDIRNSTIEQNKALQQDTKNILNNILETLTNLIHQNSHQNLLNILIRTKKWIKDADDIDWAGNKTALQQFLDKEVKPGLEAHLGEFPQSKNLIDACLRYIGNGSSGAGNTNRQLVGDSIQVINTAITAYLNEARQQLQSISPHYFEPFRTDGVEYDIYVGQSITPEQHFDDKILNKICHWQIAIMAHMARLTHKLQHQLHKPLQTTQLIFIHGNSIDIIFRNDERRFDVEGSYNIRYEVIKKRIDKALIKDSAERLTQPGKLAFVFLDGQELVKYERYIRHFQDKNILANDLEYLELNELQGVHGLKALRVSVILQKVEVVAEQQLAALSNSGTYENYSVRKKALLRINCLHPASPIFCTAAKRQYYRSGRAAI